MLFTIADIGDAAYNLLQQTVTAGGTIAQSGCTYCKNTTAAPLTLTLTRGYSLVVIKDIAGNAATYPITIVAADASDIDASANYVINVNYAWVWLSDNGTNYSVVG